MLCVFPLLLALKREQSHNEDAASVRLKIRRRCARREARKHARHSPVSAFLSRRPPGKSASHARTGARTTQSRRRTAA